MPSERGPAIGGSSGRTSGGMIGTTTAWTFVRFLAVGGSAALVYAGVCAVLTSYFPGSAILIGVAVHAMLIPVAFWGHRRLTFASRADALQEFARYAALQLASITLSSAALAGFARGEPLFDLLVFLLVAATAAVVSFVICNVFVFGRGGRA